MSRLWSFLSGTSTKHEDDLTKPIQFAKKRTQSDGELTEYEEWSDLDDSQSLECEVSPEEEFEKSTPARIPSSRFNVFRKSASKSFHDEQLPTAPETGRRRHYTRPSETITTEELKGMHRENTRNPYQAKDNATASRTLDMALFAAYLCSCVVLAFPVMILPTAAAELTADRSGTSVAAFVASVASIATFGAGVGKFVNGFVCKWIGGQKSSFLYLIGMALCSIYLSNASTHIALAMAGIEFFSSIQFTSMALVLSNHYERDATKLAAGMTTVSFGSTFGMLAANALGAALLHHCNWRTVAGVGAVIALVAAFIIHRYVKDFPCASVSNRSPKSQHEQMDLWGIIASLKHVLGSRLFWQAGAAHAMAFLARTSDRVLSTFFQEATLLPRNVCGGLLACLAFGYMHGLATGRKIAQAKTIADKTRLLRKRYAFAVLSALCLAMCANKRAISLLRRQSNLVVILAVALSSGAMTSFLAFQIYLLPPMVANTFGKNKPVCLSFLDGLGYFLASPIWATTSRIVSHPLLDPHGWTVAWTMLALFFAIGGGLMMRALPPVLQKIQNSVTTGTDQRTEPVSEVSHQA